MNSNYITRGKSRTGLAHRSFGKLIALVLVSITLFGLTGFAASSAQPTKAEAFDPIQWLACRFDDNALPRVVYQITQTSDLQFQLFSKSYVGTGSDDVRSGLNSILDYIMTKGESNSPYSFEAVNERIIGQNFEGSLPVNDQSYKRWNNGAKVNPYNRFGVAGLKFSNYMGEWKHLFIDACEADDKPDVKYDTGESTNIVRVTAWNVCSFKNVCNLPGKINGVPGSASINPITGAPFTPDEVWDDWSERAQRGAARELAVLQPDVLLGQEVTNGEPNGVQIYYDTMCAGMKYTQSDNSNKICYNPEKFRAVPNSEFEGAQGSRKFKTGGSASWTWAILEDNSYRRSLWISVHTSAGGPEVDNERESQTKEITKFIKNEFAGSFYPIVLGGDWNSYDPKDCATVGAEPGRNGPATELCANGFVPANSIATTRIDQDKASFQGFSPWSSKGCAPTPCKGPRIDHIWVNSFIGVGEARTFAPAGIATSDHAAVANTLNLNGTSVAQPGDPQDPLTNKYYDTRIEPKSTWEDINTSEDVRTQQFSRGFGQRFSAAVMVNVTNGVFFFTKLIVVLTIALIGLSFTDVSDLLGITDMVAGSASEPGLFQSLHEGLFMPLIWLSILGTAIYLVWHGLVKRQYRAGLGGLLKSGACFLAAVAISVSPAWFISLPNNVAIVGQALVAEQFSQSLVGGNGLCDSNLAASDTILSDTGTLDPADSGQAAGFLEKVSVNLQSGTGCVLWYNLLLRPWAEGQFGTPYTDLYGTEGGKCVSNGSKDDEAADDTKGYDAGGRHVCLGEDKAEGYNRNAEWVGDPIVPVGNDKIISNWALLQVSTQTNAHSPILAPEDRGVASRYSQGVAHDWWRIVDALSNYDEEFATDNPCANISTCSASMQGVKTAPYPQPLKTDVMEEWDTWTGNSQGSRLVVVFTSLLIAIMATIAPLFFAGLSVIYSIGIAIMMAFAPIFFLFGCWAGRGWEIFKAWADLIINTTMKRIALGILTILSIAIISTVLQMAATIGIIQSTMLMAVLSFVLWKARNRIFNLVSFSRLSTRDLSGGAKRMAGMMKSSTKGGAQLAGSTAVGGVAAARSGNSFKSGALAGFKGQVETMSYRSKFLRDVTNTRDMFDTSVTGIDRYLGTSCASCGKTLEAGIEIYESFGPYVWGVVCQECAFTKGDLKEIEVIGTLGDGQGYKGNKYYSPEADPNGQFTEVVKKADAELGEKIEALGALISHVTEEIRRHDYTTQLREGEKVGGMPRGVARPALPKELAPYVDTAAIGMAWDEQEYEYVKLAYAAGWMEWARKEAQLELSPNSRLTLLNRTQQTDNGM